MLSRPSWCKAGIGTGGPRMHGTRAYVSPRALSRPESPPGTFFLLRYRGRLRGRGFRCFRAPQEEQPFGHGCPVLRVGIDPPPPFKHQPVRAKPPLVVHGWVRFLYSHQLVADLVTAERGPLVGFEERDRLTHSPALQDGIGGEVRDVSDRGTLGVWDHLAELRLDLLVLAGRQPGLGGRLENRVLA